MEQHVIVCGLGLVGWRVLATLQSAGVAVVAIDNRCAANDPRLGNARLVSGDCRQAESLIAADVATARGVLVLTSSDLVSISTALMIRTLNPTVRVVVRMFNKQLIQRLGAAAGNMVALSTSALTAPLFGLIARTGQALGTFQMDSGERMHVAEVKIDAGSPLVGQRLGDIASRQQIKMVAHVDGTGNARFLHDVDESAKLAARDRLVLLCERTKLTALLAEIDPGNKPELAWAGMMRRFFRMVVRTLGEIDLGVKICTSLLLIVIVTSTLVFHFGLKDDSLPDAFYRTISLMATGAEMGEASLERGNWQKVFVSVLRIVGAALTALFTAILTNYFVRAQLGGALEVRRIPDSGHLIVCGMGNVGFRIVEDLIAEGENVVVIERSRDNPFISTARRLGAVVIIGDATVPQLLKQANSAGSRAVLAVTDNDLVNLEVALLTREVQPNQRVVLRLGDPNLARTLREAADVRLAMSIPDLAAPAFVAALYGDQVRSVFFVAGKLLTVVDVVVKPGDAMEGKPMRGLEANIHLLSLGVAAADGVTRLATSESGLEVGARITCMLGLRDLKRLLLREPGPRDQQTAFRGPEPLRP